MLDWMGSGKLESKYLEDMKAAGVEVEFSHPLRWYNLGRMAGSGSPVECASPISGAGQRIGYFLFQLPPSYFTARPA